MARETRYEALKDRLRRQFSRSKTFSIDLAPGETETVIHIDDPEFVENDDFQEHGPFNHVRVWVEDGEATVYPRTNREAFYVATRNGTGPARNLEDVFGKQYFGYLRIEADETDGFTGRVHIANSIDSNELELLKMSGLLNLEQ